MAGAAALVAGAAATAIFLAVFGGAPEPVDEAPAPVVAPLSVSEGEAQIEVPAAAAPTVEAVTPPELIADSPKVKTIDLAPMVLNIPEVKPPPTPVAAEARELKLPSGAATRLSYARSGEGLTLTLTLSPKSKVDRAFLLQNPPRLAIDVAGGAPRKSHVVQGPDASLFHRVRVGRASGNTTRLVVDLARAGKTVQTQGAQITVTP
jgi:hypothetical protein